jgi:DNA-binding LacI/PurR family transcriptional regulator
MAVSIREVAARAGVSCCTVSKALNNVEGRIPPQTRERVRLAAAELGYQPNRFARGVVKKRTETLGLMISGLQNPFFVDLAEDAERILMTAGYQVVLDAAPRSPGVYHGDGKLRGWPMDGVLMWARPNQTLALYLGPWARDLPVVYLGDLRNDGSDAVAFDLAGGGRQAAEHFAGRGYRRVAHVSHWADDDRHTAFRQTCQERDLTVESLLIEMEPHQQLRAAGLRAGEALAARPAATRPEAVFCHNDLIAVGVYRALRRAGLRVPEDVAVLGFDGIDEVRYLESPLTTIACSTETMCRTALEILLRRIGGDRDTPPRQIAIPTTLVAGGTT